MVNGANNVGNTGNNQPSIQAYEGISVDKIKRDGSRADARAIDIYDTNNDGKLTGDEVEAFNNTERTLSEDGKKLSIFNNQDGKNQRIDITAPQITLDWQGESKRGLEDCSGYNRMSYSEDRISFDQTYIDKYKTKNKYTMMRGGISLEGNNTKIDMNFEEGKLSVINAEGTENRFSASNTDVEVENSEINEITMYGGSLTTDGVHDKTLWFETDTTVKTDGDTTINQKDSSLDIERMEEYKPDPDKMKNMIEGWKRRHNTGN